MTQKGLLSSGTSSTIDQLSYGYQIGTNRLVKVTDGAAIDSLENLGDFQDGNKSGNDYAYDGNGNLPQDLNKKISGISYNVLNLPSKISVTGNGTIYYIYDAAGGKQRRRTVDSTSLPGIQTTTLYLGSTLYQNDTLKFFGTAEGRSRPASSYSGWINDYFLKDHLGNTRVIITDDYTVSSAIIEVNSYYPYGLEMKNIGYHQPGVTANPYKYNSGAELNQQLGINLYETTFRSLDPQIGRLWQLDPRPDPMGSLYATMAGNPILFSDPLGDTIKYDNEGQYSQQDDITVNTGGGGRGGYSYSDMDYGQFFHHFGDNPFVKDHTGSHYFDAGMQRFSESSHNPESSTTKNNIQAPYIIQDGKQVPLSNFNTGTEDFQGGFVSQKALSLDDEKLRSYLGSNSSQWANFSDKLAIAGIASTGLIKANPWYGGTIAPIIGLQGRNASLVSSLYNQVTLDYLGQSQRNGLNVIIQQVDISQMGASLTYYNVQFYFPQGELFEQINYSIH